MKKLKIENINKYTYELIDDNNRKYQFNFEFIGLENELKENDLIYISAELLNPRYAGYSTFYTFGNLEHECGKKDISSDDIDVIKLVTSDKEIYLKRLYG